MECAEAKVIEEYIDFLFPDESTGASELTCEDASSLDVFVDNKLPKLCKSTCANVIINSFLDYYQSGCLVESYGDKFTESEQEIRFMAELLAKVSRGCAVGGSRMPCAWSFGSLSDERDTCCDRELNQIVEKITSNIGDVSTTISGEDDSESCPLPEANDISSHNRLLQRKPLDIRRRQRLFSMRGDTGPGEWRLSLHEERDSVLLGWMAGPVHFDSIHNYNYGVQTRFISDGLRSRGNLPQQKVLPIASGHWRNRDVERFFESVEEKTREYEKPERERLPRYQVYGIVYDGEGNNVQ
eukprot:GHVL01000735.1.p1 GENE.GHVL01000735.1~~GHVL01000735.1.p1  ORF type:complete len:298 (-),score=40.93 GHVL01000735.1:212-1105(-)